MPASFDLRLRLFHDGHHVGGDRQQLERHEDAHEIASRGHHHHAEHAAQQQHVELALVVAALFEFGLAQQHHDVGSQQEQRLQDQRVVVDHVSPVEQRSHAVAGDREDHHCDEAAQQHEAGDRRDRPLLRFGELQIEQQDDVDPIASTISGASAAQSIEGDVQSPAWARSEASISPASLRGARRVR